MLRGGGQRALILLPGRTALLRTWRFLFSYVRAAIPAAPAGCWPGLHAHLPACSALRGSPAVLLHTASARSRCERHAAAAVDAGVVLVWERVYCDTYTCWRNRAAAGSLPPLPGRKAAGVRCGEAARFWIFPAAPRFCHAFAPYSLSRRSFTLPGFRGVARTHLAPACTVLQHHPPHAALFALVWLRDHSRIERMLPHSGRNGGWNDGIRGLHFARCLSLPVLNVGGLRRRALLMPAAARCVPPPYSPVVYTMPFCTVTPVFWLATAPLWWLVEDWTCWRRRDDLFARRVRRADLRGATPGYIRLRAMNTTSSPVALPTCLWALPFRLGLLFAGWRILRLACPSLPVVLPVHRQRACAAAGRFPLVGRDPGGSGSGLSLCPCEHFWLHYYRHAGLLLLFYCSGGHPAFCATLLFGLVCRLYRGHSSCFLSCVMYAITSGTETGFHWA